MPLGLGEHEQPTNRDDVARGIEVDEVQEPNENGGVGDWLVADSTSLMAHQERNKNGVLRIAGKVKEELPNEQYVQIKGGTMTLPVDSPAEEDSAG